MAHASALTSLRQTTSQAGVAAANETQLSGSTDETVYFRNCRVTLGIAQAERRCERDQEGLRRSPAPVPRRAASVLRRLDRSSLPDSLTDYRTNLEFFSLQVRTDFEFFQSSYTFCQCFYMITTNFRVTSQMKCFHMFSKLFNLLADFMQ